MSGQLISDQTIFLLGGHDLEMQEIRKILDEKEMKYFDFNLQWGATLSSYSTVFDDEHTFVGIELIADCTLPLHYIEIDHHNDKSHLPSSIEQVAELLGLELNRWQQLVAGNDRGYIPELEKMRAKTEEIEEIRFKDRKAQGVTGEDEELAKESINKNTDVHGELLAVESLTTRFSAITDRLYPVSKLIITNNDQLIYYGLGIKILAQQFEDLLKAKKAFYGGGHSGFFGISPGYYNTAQINEFKKRIIVLTKYL